MNGVRSLVFVIAAIVSLPALGETVEFCLSGEFDLGARYQGLRPAAGELYPAHWCVTTEDGSDRVLLSMHGNSNPDMVGDWSVAFLPPDTVRIVNADPPPDVEFHTSRAADEALRVRVLDPSRVGDSHLLGNDLISLEAMADLPLRGRVPVRWRWTAAQSDQPTFEIEVDGAVFFRGKGHRRKLEAEQAKPLWRPTPGGEPVQIPGDRWPARVAMELIDLADNVYVVRGVRTGFHHMVVQTAEGLVVADAPAGWVELHQFPPTDLVPGLGISGLSEKLIDFLDDEFPGVPVRAVALTHHHDDHAGGARAFAAAGADIYAPAEAAAFLESALNRDSMPPDRLGTMNGTVRITPVADMVSLDDPAVPVRFINMGVSPHVVGSLGVLANTYFFQSDLHVPNSDSNAPRDDRYSTECWFAEWAVGNLPEGTIVINTHSTYATPLARLGAYLESDLCSDDALEQ